MRCFLRCNRPVTRGRPFKVVSRADVRPAAEIEVDREVQRLVRVTSEIRLELTRYSLPGAVVHDAREAVEDVGQDGAAGD